MYSFKAACCNALAKRLLWLAVLATVSACGGSGDFGRHRGAAMGTYVKVVYGGGCRGDIGQAVADELEEVENEMSPWRPNSAVSRFNAGAANQWVPVPPALAEVVSLALALSRESDGAFDPTLAPLVNLWGFGPQPRRAPPDAAEIEAALARVGHAGLEARLHPPALRKRSPFLALDLSAIGKGHAVDRVAALLERQGCGSYLVDIGGEARTLGRNPQGGAWRIGLEHPEGGPPVRVLALSGEAVATSGDYRNFRMDGGRRLGHILDPRTGRPVEHGLASVTVVAASAAEADGLATLINVLGPQAGLRFVQRRNLAALLLTRGAEAGTPVLRESYTDAMRKHFGAAQ